MTRRAKAEWTKYHDAMWMQMKKDKNGMVSVKDMGMMESGMAKDQKAMKDDTMMKGAMKDDKMKK